jgi:hypothetical protein
MSVYDRPLDDYSKSVLDCADERGMLSEEDAKKVVADHAVMWSEWVREKPMGCLAQEARPLLHWLGR